MYMYRCIYICIYIYIYIKHIYIYTEREREGKVDCILYVACNLHAVWLTNQVRGQ